MSNYSGSAEEKLQKRREYDRKRKSIPDVVEKSKLNRKTPEYREMMRKASQKYRATKEYRVWKAAYRAQPSQQNKRRDTILRQTFGITLEDYNKMLETQNGVCKICGKIDPVRSLAVDHCHSTGKIRGLLCSHCNKGLGLFKDDIDNLREAIRYLNVI